MLAEGKLHVQRDDYWENRSIIQMIGAGEMFGEAYVAPESGVLLNDVLAVEDCTVIFFDVKRIITVCSSACRFHSMVVQNLFFAISEKNRKLVQKLGYMSRRTTREKLIAYLSEEAKRQNSSEFPYHLTASSLRIFFLWTEVPCPMSFVKCGMRDYWNLKEVPLSCYKHEL